MKIGVMCGPASGRGSAAAEIAGRLSDRLGAHEVAVAGGGFGCDPLPRAWSRLVAPESCVGYVEELRAAVALLLGWGAETLICIGGDGLASYTLDAMIQNDRKVPLLGIAAGTINVGPIVAFRPEDIPQFDIADLATRHVDAVEVRVDGRHLAYAVNDVVLGNSFLGTLDGETVNLSARALLRDGVKQRIEPSATIATEAFDLRKNGARIEVATARPAQIIASPFRPREFFGRAIAGVLCNAAFMDGAAALGLFDTIIVRAAEPARGFRDTARAEHLLFGPGDLIEIAGLSDDADIIVDGNPYAREGRTVQLSLSPAIAQAFVEARP